MAASFLIGLREGLEAALILGVTFGVFRRLRRPELALPAQAGIVAAVVVSVAAANTQSSLANASQMHTAIKIMRFIFDSWLIRSRFEFLLPPAQVGCRTDPLRGAESVTIP